MKLICGLLAIILLAATASFGISIWTHSRQPEPIACSPDSLAHYLSLSTSQQKQIQPMFADLAVKRVQAIRERDKTMRHLISILRSPRATDRQIEMSLKDVDAAQSQLRRQTVQHLLRLKTVLTPEQSDKLFDLVRQRFCVDNCNAGMSIDREAKQ